MEYKRTKCSLLVPRARERMWAVAVKLGFPKIQQIYSQLHVFSHYI